VKISYLGFAPIKVLAGTLKNKKITMSESAEKLEEVVITVKKPKDIKSMKRNIEYAYLFGGLSMLGWIIFIIKKNG